MRPLYKQYLGAAVAGLFVAAVAVNLYANYLGDPFLANRSKPLLMPLLALTALLFFPEWRPHTEKWLLAAALAFGTAGDVLLLYKGQLFFLLGMAMFLLGHLCYLTIFAKMGLYRRMADGPLGHGGRRLRAGPGHQGAVPHGRSCGGLRVRPAAGSVERPLCAVGRPAPGRCPLRLFRFAYRPALLRRDPIL